MKKPDYSLIKGIKFTPPGSSNNQDAAVQFPSGTLVFPFWNEGYIPKHIKEDFDTIKKGPSRWLEIEGGIETKDLVLCIIGRAWVPVPRKCIRTV